jgi:formate dehydrogenase subunit delta
MTSTAHATEHLTKMANQIGSFFEAMPDRAEALEGAARHIHNFWAPPMRKSLLEQIDDPDADALSAFMAEVVRTHRALIA